MKAIGTINLGLNTPVLIIEESDEYFFCKDIDTFSKASQSQKFMQQIQRLINTTIFFHNGSKAVQLGAFSEEEKRTRQK